VSKRGRSRHARTCTAVDILRVTQLLNRYGADADWGVVDGDAHWRHLANTTELLVCCGDAALCQVTVTIYTFICLFIHSHTWQYNTVKLQKGSNNACIIIFDTRQPSRGLPLDSFNFLDI